MFHNYPALLASKGIPYILSVQTTSYGENTFVYMTIRAWSDIQKKMKCKKERNSERMKRNVEHIFICSAKIRPDRFHGIRGIGGIRGKL